jgi:hypothetical protein
MELRARSGSVSYSDDRSIGNFTDYSLDSKPASKWKEDDIDNFRIKVIDVQDMFPTYIDLPNEAHSLVVPEWKNGNWLFSVDVKLLPFDNKVKTMIVKLRKIHMALSSGINITEDHVDGFMDSLLHLLCFDDYPCSVYPQYKHVAHIKNNKITARPDFSVFSEESKILLIVEDKISSASAINNWMEPQILGELFVAFHNTAASNRNVKYPVILYAVRVVNTIFTFYKVSATLEYIRETAINGEAVNNELIVDRYPKVEQDKLTVYDILNSSDRFRILQCLCYIRKDIL